MVIGAWHIISERRVLTFDECKWYIGRPSGAYPIVGVRDIRGVVFTVFVPIRRPLDDGPELSAEVRQCVPTSSNTNAKSVINDKDPRSSEPSISSITDSAVNSDIVTSAPHLPQ